MVVVGRWLVSFPSKCSTKVPFGISESEEEKVEKGLFLRKKGDKIVVLAAA